MQINVIQSGSRFRRNIFRIAIGTISSQAIILSAMPFLARLYNPEAFGILALFMAMYAIFSGLLTLKYDLSIILPTEYDTAINLTVLTLLLSLTLSLFFEMVLLIGSMNFGVSTHWFYLLLPISTFLSAAYTCGQQWCARSNDYRRFSRSQVVNSLLNISAALLLAIVGIKFDGGLVIAFVVGLAASVIYLSIGSLLTHLKDSRLTVHLPTLANVALEYKRFPLFVLPSSFIATLGLSSHPLILQTMFSLHEIGLYAIANRILIIPSALIGGAIGEAFRAEFVDRIRRGIEVSSFFRDTLHKLVFISAPIFGILFLVTPTLFTLIFGETYGEAGILSRYLCLGVFSQFIAQPFLYVFIATGYERLGLFINIVTTVLPLLGIILGGLTGHIEHALLFSALLMFASSTFMIGLAYRCCRQNDNHEVAPRENHV